ncbi:sialate:H+ symport family MFS transporter [Stackebrandtia nassauensis]|uniref:Major facilitator superfamily MFS_1 n=1 Tax=Stackebrandtia nassauensis (strain DSM 44728 / CIP 108903 / NRRL B-16338 / NBRC 102104 / LLR-40K-21) TaxID=446470 RepID=D3Q1E4_STANL|nr:sialate:H+ symport family MFS transporter [Stackebrandtia nassauensis]ADD45724.1 major facilitator superfamily MFS_1 [Stackebrandtia nassauensis DSM 44728]
MASPTGIAGSFRQLSAPQRKAFFAAWLGYLLDGFDFILITLVLTEIADEFDLGLTAAATLVSAAFVSRWLGGLLLGSIGDRFGRKPAMIISILAFSVGSLLCGLAWGYWSLFVFRAIVGLGMAGEYGSSATYVMESWPKSMRNRATGFLLSAYPIGTVVAALAYQVIVPLGGWRWLFFAGLLPIALTLYLRRALPEAAEWQAEVGDRADKDVATSSVLFTPRRRLPNALLATVLAAALVLLFSENTGGFGWLLIAVTVAGFVAFTVQVAGRLWPVMLAIMVTVFSAFLYSWPIQSLLPTYLKTELHYTAGQVSTALTWAGLGYAAGCCLAGVVADRLGTRVTYVGGLFISLLFVVPVFILPAGNIVLLWILLFVMQATSQGISGLLPKYIGDHFPTRLRAAGLGFSYNVGALGGALAPLAGAAIAAEMDSLGHALMILAGSLTVLVALIIGFDIPARIGRALKTDSEAPAFAKPEGTLTSGL